MGGGTGEQVELSREDLLHRDDSFVSCARPSIKPNLTAFILGHILFNECCALLLLAYPVYAAFSRRP